MRSECNFIPNHTNFLVGFGFSLMEYVNGWDSELEPKKSTGNGIYKLEIFLFFNIFINFLKSIKI